MRLLWDPFSYHNCVWIACTDPVHHYVFHEIPPDKGFWISHFCTHHFNSEDRLSGGREITRDEYDMLRIMEV